MTKFPHPLITEFERWPKAVPEHAVCCTEADRTRRAAAVADLLVPLPIIGMNVLDFGAGDGTVARELAARGAKAHATDPDIMALGRWPSVTNVPFHRLPDDFYDLILVIDVLDHADDPEDALAHAAKTLAPGGTMIVRCHPYLSRHGGHTHDTHNYAFAHLATDIPHTPGHALTDPTERYNFWVARAGLEVASHSVITDPVEPFFYRHFPEELNQFAPPEILAQSFHDFVLKRS